MAKDAGASAARIRGLRPGMVMRMPERRYLIPGLFSSEPASRRRAEEGWCTCVLAKIVLRGNVIAASKVVLCWGKRRAYKSVITPHTPREEPAVRSSRTSPAAQAFLRGTLAPPVLLAPACSRGLGRLAVFGKPARPRACQNPAQSEDSAWTLKHNQKTAPRH